MEQEINTYIKDTEHTANKYVMRCFSVTMIVYLLTFLLNTLKIFTIEQSLMIRAFVPSVIIYLLMVVVYKFCKINESVMKYFLLASTVLVYMITGVFLTYHVVLIALLPFLYAALYSSKRVMWFVYIFTVISTVVQVYGGYYLGLCDANMVLLTTEDMSTYIDNGKFILNEINNNPILNLGLFFVLPRCLIYIAFMSVCNSIFKILSKSLEMAKLTDEMKQLKEEAESANKAKSQFLARVSHEVRTPINAVIGMNEMILRESDNSEIRKYAYDAKNSSLILLSIINEILDASKIESGKMEVISADYELGSVFNDIYNMISIKAKEKGLDLKMDIDYSMPVGYVGDVRMIRQVLINLLNNAVKYTDKGRVTFTCRYTREGDYVTLHFAIMDTGIGIKEEDLEKLSEEFQRFDLEKNKNVEGTGLGMSIVKSFLKLMGSELKVRSEYGRGSEFSFDIVQKVSDETTLKSFMENLGRGQDMEQVRCEYVAPKARVLVVDDYKMNIKVFVNLLKRTKIEIVEATSGEECISILEKEKFNIVFLDHMMPGMDGVETLKVIKDRKLCEATPVVMLTANAIVGNKEKYLNMGFDDFVSKPIIPNKLDDVILKLLPKELVIINKNNKEVEEKMSDEELFEFIQKELVDLDYSVVDTTCCGDVNFYMELFHDFTELNIKSELSGFLEASDAKNYCIKVHGFKNNAYTIGAKALGDLALKLETITKTEITDEVSMLQGLLFEQYDRICKVYNSKR